MELHKISLLIDFAMALPREHSGRGWCGGCGAMFLIHTEVTDQNPVLNILSEQVRLVQSQTYRLRVQYHGVKQKITTTKSWWDSVILRCVPGAHAYNSILLVSDYAKEQKLTAKIKSMGGSSVALLCTDKGFFCFCFVLIFCLFVFKILGPWDLPCGCARAHVSALRRCL